VVPQFPQRSETFIVSKFFHLWKKGWDVHIITNRFARSLWKQFPELAAHPSLQQRVHAAPPSRPMWKAAIQMPFRLLYLFLRHPQRSFRYCRRGWPQWKFLTLKRLYLDTPIMRLNPDIIHFEFGAIAVERTYMKNMGSWRMAVSFRGYDISYAGLPDKDYYRNLWKVVDGVHFLGKDLLRRAVQRGFPQAKIFYRLIPPALDLEKFPPPDKTRRSTGPLRILSVGRLEWKKGYEYALLAMKALQKAGIPFEYRIVGTGKMEAALYLLRHRLGLTSEVAFLGGMPHAKVIEQLQWADVLVHASVSEGFCNAVQEAQAMEVPAVVSDAEGLPENVADGETGFVVRRRDPQALAEKIIELYRDPERRLAMGKAGRRRVERLFTIEQQADAFDEFYRTLLSRPRRGDSPEASE